MRPASHHQPSSPTFYFHIRSVARKKYQVKDELFSIRGDVIFSNFQQARELTEKLNLTKKSETLHPSQLNAMGLIHEILHFVMESYRKDVSKNAYQLLLSNLTGEFSSEAVDHLLLNFIQVFPPPAVFKDQIKPQEFLNGSTDGMPHRQWLIEEVILLYVTNQNPGYQPIQELITDEDLKKLPEYGNAIKSIQQFFINQPGYGPKGQNLIELLLEPARRSPSDLMAQLEFIRSTWGDIIKSSPFLNRLLISMDFIKEEGKWFLFKQGGWNVSKDIEVSAPSFSGELYEHEPEAFSDDLDWMPRVVMIAKSTFVWLDQLSKETGKHLEKLNDIPDEELDRLAHKGITALWLIGLWNRSKASQRIKVMRGNPEAVASAYSLYDYNIADELGGFEAYSNLRDRCWQRGIRLASDMVPNHMGIDSTWVLYHPEWFLQLPYPPYPNYQFSGTDLSHDSRMSVYIEDGYWNQTDAAVVFKRVDNQTGETRYIYHGNDGTSFPWNDTAQLNYMKQEVREAVIQTIIHVAKLFPIIRFDAAMTLAKRHFQRLWFPVPGSGGDIPSRAEHALTKEQFDSFFPVEFWREVVDRIAVEVPNTLLLAEAFWMMEGYFVRTLGMHRVYNSAFMHMFKKEDNSGYRYLIKNTLEFNPQILKRYVNFMNNPDEETAVNQFGKGDKYFGICLMMSTLPGLPMFGHGQFEGYSEKYGMEYKKAYKDEKPDQWLIDRHFREIVPILKKRYLFSEVDNFLLFDFYAISGVVNEDVFAFSNSKGNEHALVFYHNKYATTSGYIRTSSAFLTPNGHMTQRDLAFGLRLPQAKNGQFIIFKDQITGLEFIRKGNDLWEKGFYIELEAFTRHVFIGYRVVNESDGMPYGKVEKLLGGKGTHSIEGTVIELRMKPVHQSFYQMINSGSVMYLKDGMEKDKVTKEHVEEFQRKIGYLLDGVNFLFGSVSAPEKFAQTASEKYSRAITAIHSWIDSKESSEWAIWIRKQFTNSHDSDFHWLTIITWLTVREFDGLKKSNPQLGSDSIFNHWHLDRIFKKTAEETGFHQDLIDMGMSLLNWANDFTATFDGKNGNALVASGLMDYQLRPYLNVNLYNDVIWFNKERMESLTGWVILFGWLNQTPLQNGKVSTLELKSPISTFQKLQEVSGKSEFQLAKLTDLISKKEKAKKASAVARKKVTAKKPIVKVSDTKKPTEKIKKQLPSVKKKVTKKTK